MTPADPYRVFALPVYERWTASWDAALAALGNAGQIRALSADETEEHRKTIASEREVVAKRLAFMTQEA
jgi:hypothetical protein